METAYWSAPLAFMFWIPVAAWIMQRFPGERGVATAIVFGWLFLPNHLIDVSGFVDISKLVTLSAGVLFGCLVTDPKRLVAISPGLLDLPVAGSFLVPMASAYANGLGLYDGISASGNAFLNIAVLYWIGRCYLGSTKGCYELSRAILVGTLVYLPLILVEMRMSPQINRWVYGFQGFEFIQQMRFGGYRPVVFLGHGLITALLLAISTVIAAWFWHARAMEKLYRIPIGWIVIAFGVCTVLCRSVNGVILMTGGLALVFLRGRALWRPAMIILLCAAPIYVSTRIAGSTHYYTVGHYVSEYISDDRAASYEFRLNNEDMLMEKALRRPWLGWSGWGRSRVTNMEGKDVSVTDGTWIIVLGTTGLTGLCFFLLYMLLPGLRLMSIIKAEDNQNVALVPAIALTTVLGLWSVDSLMNSPILPFGYATLGALCSLRFNPQEAVSSIPTTPAATPVTRFI